MSNILVTGGAGFIGSHVAEELVDRNHRVIVLDDLSGGFEDNIVEGAEFIKGSINDVKLVENLFREKKIDYVYHLADYAAEGLSHFIKRFNYQNNLVGSVNLINASINADVKCFVFSSSIAVYGNTPDLPITEDTIPYPGDPYGIAKLAVEHDLRVSKEIFDLNYIIFRPHNVYGERQNISDKYRNVIGIFISQIIQDRPVSIFGDGSQMRAFSYIGDVAPVMADAVSVPGAYNQIFNIGADTPYTINALARHVAAAMGVKLKATYLPARKEVHTAYSSHKKMESVFGKRTLFDLDEGLKRMSEWVSVHGTQKSREFDRIEVSKNFPRAWSHR